MLLACLSSLYSHHSSTGSGLVTLNCVLFLQHPFCPLLRRFWLECSFCFPFLPSHSYTSLSLYGQSLLSFPAISQNTLSIKVFKYNSTNRKKNIKFGSKFSCVFYLLMMLIMLSEIPHVVIVIASGTISIHWLPHSGFL